METRTDMGEVGAGAQPSLPIAITATFTAEPIEKPLRFWLKELGLAGPVCFAPYNQIFQELLDPNSLLGRNKAGINLLLVRFEDWTRFRSDGPLDAVLRRHVEELASALQSFAKQSSTPTLVWVGPPSPAVARDPKLSALMTDLQERLRTTLQAFDSLSWLGPESLEPYQVDEIHDPRRDRIGHIPYTPLYYTALATAAARRIHAIRTAPYKVLALDCDQTLWQGVVGEQGPLGVALPPGKRALQEFAVRQQQLGMLLCLVSKNVESDVFAVFEQRPEMPLRRELLVAWRINWQPKAHGITELAAELNLGLDSFVFVDDNPVECAEVRAALPEVLTLQLPPADDEIPEFLRHVWAFDRRKGTREDQRRTLLYRQNVERSRFEHQAVGIREFLAALQLRIGIGSPSQEEWPRVAQLTQRTNQFNFTTVRRTEAEVRRLGREGLECLRIQVLDRFGDYGLVGVLIFGAWGDALRIDTMLLSCRVLGRGVEHAMLAHLGHLARERGLSWVEAPLLTTPKNQPAANFLQEVGSAYRQEAEKGAVYRFPAGVAARTEYVPGGDVKEPLRPGRAGDAEKDQDQPAGGATSPHRNLSVLYTRIATELRQIAAVHHAVEADALAARPELETPLVEPRTPVQRALADLWARLLHLGRVGIRDDFATLGGTSLIAAHIFAEIEEQFGTRLPMTTILEAPTVERLAERIEGGARVSLKLLKPGLEGGAALYLVHDGEGETLLYVNLACRLPEEVAVYGVEPYGTDRCPVLHTRISDMASYYLGQIRRAQPQGPYFLGGMCAGGVIAFEMALQLQAEGLPVGLVALLDAAAPRAQRRVGLVSQRRQARFVQALRDGQGGPALKRLTRQVARAALKVRNLVIYEVTSRARRLSKRLRFRLLRSVTDQGRPVPRLLQGLTFRTVYEVAESEYQPAERLDAPVILFRATDGEGADEAFVHLFADPLLGWGRHVAAEPKVVEVAGGHSSMLREPHVGALAERMTAWIERGLTVEVAP